MYLSPNNDHDPNRLPKPGTPAALVLVREARQTPPMNRDPLQLALAAAFKRDGAGVLALVGRGAEFAEHVGYALDVYAAEYGRGTAGMAEAA